MLTLFKALADPSRLRLLRILRQGEFTVQELTGILAMGQSRISRHLKILCDAGILRVEPQGTWRYYRFAPQDPLFRDLWPAIERQLDDCPEREADAAGTAAVMAARRRRSREFFDRHASSWDDWRDSKLRLPDYQARLLSLVPVGGICAEVGVGSGRLLEVLTRKGGQVIGIDHSPAMVEQARANLERHGVRGVEVRLGEMTHLPLADGSVQALVLDQVFHHAERPLDVLAEIRRVLAAGGSMLVADLVRHQHDWMREELADQWLGFKRAELEGWLAEAGLELAGYQRIDPESGEHPVFLLWANRP